MTSIHRQKESHTNSTAFEQPLTHFTWLSLLRAFGVVLVLIYHFFPQLLPGGFIGVDVFFVFSGYLITSLLFKEFLDNRKIGLLDFYKRRVRRLLPALVAMLLVTLPLSLLISADFRADFARQTAAALGWVTNFYEIQTGGSYANALLPHLFVHTWTLSVEMQFYLVWGVVLCLALPAFLVTKNGRTTISKSRKVIRLIAVVLALLSFIAMQLLLIGADDPSVAYYATISHLYPLMIGSIAGTLAGFGRTKTVKAMEQVKPKVAIAVTALCLAAITAMALLFDFENMLVYHFGILLTSLLVGVILLLGRGLQWRLAKHPEPKLPLYLADRSYSLYLFHWPILIIMAGWGKNLANAIAPQHGDAFGVVFAVLALIVTFVCAHLSYKFVERPFSRRRKTIAAKGSSEPTPTTKQARRLKRTKTLGFLDKNRLIGLGVVIVLLIGSITAVATAPPTTSIEQKYAHGELVLDVEQLDSAHQAFALIAQSDDRNGTPGPKIIPGSVSIVGDSVTLGAVDELSAQTDASIDADTSRAMVNGIRIIKNMEQNLTLGETVVVALATNSHADSYESAVTIINDLEPGHRIVFVTGYGDSSISDLNSMLRTLPAQYPFVTIADWEAAIQDKDSLLAADRMHMDAQEARDIYAQVIKTAIEEAKWKPTS